MQNPHGFPLHFAKNPWEHYGVNCLDMNSMNTERESLICGIGGGADSPERVLPG